MADLTLPNGKILRLSRATGTVIQDGRGNGQRIFLKLEDGKEEDFWMPDRVPLREGHKLTVFWGGPPGESSGSILFVYNHNMEQLSKCSAEGKYLEMKLSAVDLSWGHFYLKLIAVATVIGAIWVAFTSREPFFMGLWIGGVLGFMAGCFIDGLMIAAASTAGGGPATPIYLMRGVPKQLLAEEAAINAFLISETTRIVQSGLLAS